jgi:fatty acid desaturase
MSQQNLFANNALVNPVPESASASFVSRKSLPTQVFCAEQLNDLNQRFNWKGCLQLAGHLTIMGLSGYLWLSGRDRLLLALPALVIYGFSFASMFATMHESVHRTAFSNKRLNDIVAWLAALLSFYNSTFYRYYHKWHHRYTQIPDKDPELGDRKPTNWREYWLEISGIPWWVGKVKTYLKIVTGNVENYPFIPTAARDRVVRSVRLQFLVYCLGLTSAIVFGQPWFILGWLLPLVVGQPILRAILLSEHGGCTHDNNPFANTRTTLTLPLIRFLMWNMPYHAEHHFCPSIPFHALAKAHKQLKPHLNHVDAGYLVANGKIIAQFGQTSDPSEGRRNPHLKM